MVARASRVPSAWSIALLIGVTLYPDQTAFAQSTPGTPIFESIGYGALRPLEMGTAKAAASRPADAGGGAEYTILPGSGSKKVERWKISSDGVPWFAGYAPIAVYPSAITWADMDGDGAADLICGGGYSTGNNIEILRMGPSGLISPGTLVPTTTYPYYMTVGDVNGDGRPDIGVVSAPTGRITWLVNQGANTFLELPSGSGFGRPVTAQLGPDADMDLVDWDPQSFSIGIAPGSGNGLFPTPSQRFEASGPPLVSDLDSDGVPDIVAGRFLYRGLAGGSLVELDSVAANVSHRVDLDHDGVPDLVAVESGKVRVARGLGGFSFSPFTDYVAGAIDDRDLSFAYGPKAMSALLDANGDGQIDVVCVAPPTNLGPGLWSNQYGRVLYAIPGQPGGRFHQLLRVPTGNGPAQVELANLLGADDRLDLVVLDRGARSLELRAGLGNGTFGAAQSYGLPAGAQKFVFADFNEDSKLDIAVVCDTSSAVRIFAGTGAGLSAPIDLASTGSLTDLAAGDVDEDGHLDLLAVTNFGQLRAWHGDGAIGFIPVPWTSSPYQCNGRIRACDVDKDGHLDLVTQQQLGFIEPALVIQRGNGQGQFAIDYTYSRYLHGAAVIETGDLLADGRTFVAYVVLDSVQTTYCHVSAYTVEGGVMQRIPDHCDTGNCYQYNGYEVAPTARQMAVADVSGDGVPDMLVLSGYGGVLTVLPGLGGGQFGNPIEHIAGTEPSSFALGDVDGDGDLDVMVADRAANEVVLMRNLGHATAGVGPTTAGSALRLSVESAPNATQLRLRLALTNAGSARVEFFDLFGRKLLNVPVQASAPGEQSVTIDGGRLPQSGVLFARLTQGSAQASTRLARFH